MVLSMNRLKEPHRGCNWADIWGPPGLPNWDLANFVLSFHGGPTWVSLDGFHIWPIWVNQVTHIWCLHESAYMA